MARKGSKERVRLILRRGECQRSISVLISEAGVCTPLQKRIQLIRMVISESVPNAGASVFFSSIDVHSASQ
ncbi:hypothetical protein PENSUB_4650 [Penicillium subrubescens]|uniref:Uncharacterized protein n=1 Tax=Penicillium subrubescens TaxID=1316194 RepID=A0A1Q5UBS7_9EURO|nr:hypothetical protein PENSUB_4650 [Penicillium subrubescens]